MENKNPQDGVVLYHLKGKFAVADKNGNLSRKFELSKAQAQAIYDYLHFGSFKGMFDVLSLEDYIDVLAMHYDFLIAGTNDREMRSLLNSEFEEKSQNLREFYNKEQEKTQAQPM